MPLSIVVLGDLHFAASCPIPARCGHLADILLLRAVHRIRRSIQPDLVVVLGDLLDDGDAPDASERRRALNAALGLLHCPVVILPGNHDADPEAFYRDIPRPPSDMTVGDARVLSFIDPEEPGYNARRLPADVARLAEARRQHDGPIVALQHVPLLPPGMTASPYGYGNAAEILAALPDTGPTLFLSAHYHAGVPLLRVGRNGFLVTPALCETPFRFPEISIRDGDFSVREHRLRLPPGLGLWDTHVHTAMAYCNENMDPGKALELADAFGLEGVVFAEHSGQLYHDREAYWSGRFLHGQHAVPNTPGRADDYFRETGRAAAGRAARVGLEADIDFHGLPVLHPADRARGQFLIGAMHALPSLAGPSPDADRAAGEFLVNLETALGSGIRTLAHPFRVFRRARVPIPERLYLPTARLLARAGVAAELNFHTNEPPPEFVALCCANGVRLAFGSDAHNLYEVGEFAPHLELLRKCGCEYALERLVRPEPVPG